ncbi:MAG: FAD-dependent oxidoreductase [Acidobacteriota bacterium]|nr:MAG: FAD-dependent oxidoreductase [Acidobacteriota bacterium]
MNDPLRTDVAIVGAGPAGLSAALWCDELGLDALVLEAGREPGGQLLWTYNSIENYLGFEAADGREARDRFVDQIRRRGLNIRPESVAASVALRPLRVGLSKGETIEPRAVIIATGVRRNEPDLENLEHFRGRGILESGKRDKDLAIGKTVMVVGGGDAAFENALILAGTADKVFLVHRRETFRARQEFTDAVRDNSKIEIITNSEVARLEGDGGLESVTLTGDGQERGLSVGALIFRIGVRPNSELVQHLVATDSRGYIRIDSSCRTDQEGIYAVGDVANPVSPTISSASGMGATAAKAVFSWL